MKIIPLTQGKFTIVDNDAPAWIFDVKWRVFPTGRCFYVTRTALCIDGKWRTILLHRILMRASPGLEVDHIDGDGLNNLRTNLRICDHVGNSRGFQRKRANASSEFRGVSWDSQRGKWYAWITHNGHMISIGRFDDEIEAAKAFDAKARELGWPESGLNFPHVA